MSTENENGRELSWEDSIENESPEFVLLPAGKCKFEVLDFERQRFAGSAKLPPCNMAVLKIKLTAADGASTTINQNLFLHSITEGILCAFFTAIGQRKHGERLKMDWSKVRGARGECEVGIKEWISNKDGRTYQGNEIKKWLEPAENIQPPEKKWEMGKGF
jgi:hypothetical protein